MTEIDYVQIDDRVECPVCGSPLERFETKEGPGVQAFLDFRNLSHFQSRCESCHNLIEFSRKKKAGGKPSQELGIEDYEKKTKIY